MNGDRPLQPLLSTSAKKWVASLQKNQNLFLKEKVGHGGGLPGGLCRLYLPGSSSEVTFLGWWFLFVTKLQGRIFVTSNLGFVKRSRMEEAGNQDFGDDLILKTKLRGVPLFFLKGMGPAHKKQHGFFLVVHPRK